jgi:hypothetical protein
MAEKVFKKQRDSISAEKYLYFSAPFLEHYFPKRLNLIKNYIFAPDFKKIT